MVFQAKDPNAPRIGRPVKSTQFYAVTFENDHGAPVTLSGKITSSSPHRSVYLAVREAHQKVKGFRWSSLVVVIDKNHPIGRHASKADTEQREELP